MRTLTMFIAAAVVAGLVAARPAAQTRTAKALDIYVIDVEGGNATLFVAPSGESLLIDTGNGGAAAVRDAERIMAAVKDAGLKQIDHLITTHWHGDHFGGMAEVANRIPIREFIDHGGNVQPAAPTMRQSTPVRAMRSPGFATVCLALPYNPGYTFCRNSSAAAAGCTFAP